MGFSILISDPILDQVDKRCGTQEIHRDLRQKVRCDGIINMHKPEYWPGILKCCITVGSVLAMTACGSGGSGGGVIATPCIGMETLSSISTSRVSPVFCMMDRAAIGIALRKQTGR